MKSLKLIGLAGQKRQGKNTVADCLEGRLFSKEGKEWGQIALASNVRKVLCETFGFTLEFIEEWKSKPEKPPGMNCTMREAMIMIGEGYRKINPKIWINKLYDGSHFYNMVTDVRHINEARATKNQGGINVLIHKEGSFEYDRAEREILPYVQWCNFFGKKFCQVKDIPELKEKKKVDGIMIVNEDKFFRNLSLFDVYMPSKPGEENLKETINKFLIPYLLENYDVDIIEL